MKLIFSTLLLLLSTFFALSYGARILVVFTVGSHSHFILGFRLAKELADRGHEVTFINAYPQKQPIKNLREISVAAIKGVNKKQKELYDFDAQYYYIQLEWVANLGAMITENVLNLKEIQQLLQSNEKFDLVLMEHFMNEAMMIFQHKFNCPCIILAPGPQTVFNNHLFANPSQPAYIPNLLTKYGSHMTLWERFRNVYHDLVGELYVHFVLIPKQNDILQRTVPGAPDLRDILYNISFLFLATHISLRGPSPLQPNIKDIGGYHLLPPKPLPDDLQKFLDDAKEGVILFSMGSFIRSADFPQEKKEVVLKVFSRIKQKVLWKYETDLPEKPKNVKIVSWLPQQDVLAHPNVVAFVTHAGLLGTTEAIYYGVPILGLPVFWDQRKNSYDSVRRGFALSIPFAQLTEVNFAWALNEITSNPKYRDNAKIVSRIMHDQPVKPIDEAIFWIEYAIRHKGAPHLKSPALNLKWYQRLLLDVVFVLIITVASVLTIMLLILRRLVNVLKKKYGRKNKME